MSLGWPVLTILSTLGVASSFFWYRSSRTRIGWLAVLVLSWGSFVGCYFFWPTESSGPPDFDLLGIVTSLIIILGCFSWWVICALLSIRFAFFR